MNNQNENDPIVIECAGKGCDEKLMIKTSFPDNEEVKEMIAAMSNWYSTGDGKYYCSRECMESMKD